MNLYSKQLSIFGHKKDVTADCAMTSFFDHMGLVTTMRLIAFGELMPNRGAASAY